MKTAILASQNKKKIKEIRAILIKYGMDVITRDDADLPKDEIEETGTTFEENSHLKASAIMDMIQADSALSEKYSDSPVIADDSGLMVDALGGAPGVYSARYAGEDGDYAANNDKLLKELKGVQAADSTLCDRDYDAFPCRYKGAERGGGRRRQKAACGQRRVLRTYRRRAYG